MRNVKRISIEELASGIGRMAIFMVFMLGPSVLPAATEADSNSQYPDFMPAADLFDEEAREKAKFRMGVRQYTAEIIGAYLFQQTNRLAPLLRQLHNFAPDSAEYFFFEAVSHYNQSERARAMASVEKSIDTRDDFDPAWNLYALLLMEAQRFHDAEVAFRRTVELSPYDPTYNYNYASVLYSLNKTDLARHQINKAIEYRSNLAEAYYLRALILRDLGLYATAYQDMNTAEEFGLHSEAFFVHFLKISEASGHRETSLRIADRIRRSNSLPALRVLASFHMRYGEFDRALSFAERILNSAEAVENDRKMYLEVIFRSGQDPEPEVQRIARSSTEAEVLYSFVDSLRITGRRDGPGARDPIFLRPQ